jgi:hypothetical protein
MGGECEVGLRRRTYHVLSGSVLAVWSRVEGVLANRANAKMQVVRLRTAEGLKIVGEYKASFNFFSFSVFFLLLLVFLLWVHTLQVQFLNDYIFQCNLSVAIF